MRSYHKTLSDKPYKGLNHYTKKDAECFFGRDDWKEIILDNVMARRVTLLYGESGVGKSSVLDAGVVSQLEKMAEKNRNDFGTPKLAVAMFRNWSVDPHKGLVECVQDAAIEALKLSEIEAKAVKELMPPFSTLTEKLQAWSKCVGGQLYIILDQFEEYFLYQPKHDPQGKFVLEFSRAANNEDLRANLLISIRKESYVELIDHLKVHIPDLFTDPLGIKRLNREQGMEAIEKPIKQYYNSEYGQKFDIEQELTLEILKDVDVIKAMPWLQDEAGLGDKDINGTEKQKKSSQMIETSCLQLVMDRLWEEEKNNEPPILKLTTYKKLGRAEKIVKKHVNDQMKNLSPQMQNTAAYVFHYLVTSSRTKIAHTVGELVELVNSESGIKIELTKEQVEPLLRQLGQPEVRILRSILPASREQKEKRYEIFHDVLAKAILDWRTQYLDKVEREKKEREKKEREKERKKRNLRIRIYVVSGLILGGLIALWFYRETVGLKQELQQDLERSLPGNSQLDKLLAGMRTVNKYEKTNKSLFNIFYKNYKQSLVSDLVQFLPESFIGLQEQNKFKVRELSRKAIWNHRFILDNPPEKNKTLQAQWPNYWNNWQDWQDWQDQPWTNWQDWQDQPWANWQDWGNWSNYG
ncbi:MAG: hypothetical protein QNJ41_07965 [Xenococcaceae cyanobacterium MO_188.B32]|nr:hypothetical protein [Xenococcaceae cyanobacterium MO_188.B32]